MKKESEKKEKRISVRFTDEQRRIAEQKAKEKNLTLSRYIAECVCHKENSLTPEIMVHMQNLVNTACDIVKEYSHKDCAYMESEVNELWSLLK